MHRIVAAVAVAALALASAPAQAQDYPNKPIHFIVPAAAGGPTDVTTRLLARYGKAA